VPEYEQGIGRANLAAGRKLLGEARFTQFYLKYSKYWEYWTSGTVFWKTLLCFVEGWGLPPCSHVVVSSKHLTAADPSSIFLVRGRRPSWKKIMNWCSYCVASNVQSAYRRRSALLIALLHYFKFAGFLFCHFCGGFCTLFSFKQITW